jgi:hypothetical protein
MTIQAIETRYAGCRFRSRLEARWAVFFDRLGVAWEYEPQGYLVGPDNRPYLPDFWLPEEQVWVEIKGGPHQLDLVLLLAATVPHWGGLPRAVDDRRMLVLGPLPTPGGRVAHSLLTFHKGDVTREWAEFGIAGLREFCDPGDSRGNWLGDDSGDIGHPSPPLTDCRYLPGTNHGFVADAYAAARSARFEHGERP